jgi:hypothetical protein
LEGGRPLLLPLLLELLESLHQLRYSKGQRNSGITYFRLSLLLLLLFQRGACTDKGKRPRMRAPKNLLLLRSFPCQLLTLILPRLLPLLLLQLLELRHHLLLPPIHACSRQNSC